MVSLFTPEKDEAAKLKIDDLNLIDKMVKFEQSLGVTIQCCFTAVECLQTCDLAQLITHIAEVFENVLDEKYVWIVKMTLIS